VLLDDPGKPLLSSDAAGHTIVRCEAGGVVSEIRFSSVEIHDNLAFISVDAPQAGGAAQSGRFGMVREDGQWKLLSLGLLLLDVPSLAREWEQSDKDAEMASREFVIIQSLRQIADALMRYQQAFGQLPETLAQLGPSPGQANSPEKAGFLDASLTAGDNGGYRYRYSIVPATQGADESDRNKSAGFQLAATPIEYGKIGKRSFYLDSSGMLRGADKRGAVADVDDPPIIVAQP
jgi:hypothetical protein